ncbi:MAG: DNA mismatch endonuclease Vsr [Rhodobacter sp.]|nr:DNA mismatch endonuclease Vsr [Rhodobacter sp.]
MAAIRGKNTKLEMMVRRGLHSCGLRYVLHGKKLPGKPDLVFPSRKTVVFVHGCFWHAHEGCSAFRLPKTRPEEWEAKLLGNRSRDARNEAGLKALGWRVLILWECDVRGKQPQEVSALLDELAKKIRTAGEAGDM